MTASISPIKIFQHSADIEICIIIMTFLLNVRGGPSLCGIGTLRGGGGGGGDISSESLASVIYYTILLILNKNIF